VWLEIWAGVSKSGRSIRARCLEIERTSRNWAAGVPRSVRRPNWARVNRRTAGPPAAGDAANSQASCRHPRSWVPDRRARRRVRPQDHPARAQSLRQPGGWDRTPVRRGRGARRRAARASIPVRTRLPAGHAYRLATACSAAASHSRHCAACASACSARRRSPAARALVACASNCSTRCRNWPPVPRLRVGPAPLGVGRRADPFLDGAQLAVQFADPLARHLAHVVPLVLNPVQRGPGRLKAAGRIDGLASASNSSFRFAFWVNSASRSSKTADRRAKNASWAARNRCHSASSESLGARPAAFQSTINACNVRGGHPVVDSMRPSASSTNSCLRVRAAARVRSRSAKCEPRRRLNVSRALASVSTAPRRLRSTP